MQAIGQLAGGIAHDFNNALSVIQGASELIQLRKHADELMDKWINRILEATEHAADLTRKLLAFARKQPAIPRDVDIHGIIENAAELLRNTIDRRISVNLHLEAGIHHTVADATQLQSTFLNLGINAAHAMAEGGTMSISTTITELDESFCRTNAFEIVPGPYIRIDFSDTGCGIEPDNVAHIFEPFFTTKEQGKGTGLGLAAVYGMIQEHKGAITVVSTLGEGTCFRIYLPLSHTLSMEEPSGSPPVPGAGCILVVDDEKLLRDTVHDMLGELGYDVIRAENGRQGIEIFEQKMDAIDLVILDNAMPEMNGKECFREIRRLKPDIQVVLASGYMHCDDIMGLEADGLFAFIHKPYRLSELSHVIQKALANQTNPDWQTCR
jgi:CheY-like chemotaxis protein